MRTFRIKNIRYGLLVLGLILSTAISINTNRLTGQTITLATSSATRSVSLSDDGRYAVVSTNDNLDSSYPNTNAYNYDAYVIDTKSSTDQLLTFTVAGNKSGSVEGAASISADGNKAAYGYYTPSVTDATHELISGLTTGTANRQLDVYTSETGF